MKYDLLVLDIDGTVVTSDKELTPRTKRAIIELQERGVKVAIASGRPTYGVKPLAEMLELNRFGGYILSNNGGAIIDVSNDEVIHSAQMPHELIPDMYQALKSVGGEILFHDKEWVCCENIEQEYVCTEARLNKMKLRKVDNFVESITSPIVKCLGCADPAAVEELEQRLSPKYEGALSIYRSEPYFLEIVPTGIDKGASIGILLNHIGSNRQRAIAFGDGFNDLTMIDYVGTGVAMANAQQAVKDVAQAITLSNDEEGVAHYIEQHLL